MTEPIYAKTEHIYPKYNSQVEELQSRLTEKYNKHEFNWKRSGDSRYIGLCPEHEDKNPSLNVFEFNGKCYYKCFACGFHGSLFDFTGKKLSEIDIKRLAERKKRQEQAENLLKKSKENLYNWGSAIEYLEKRFGVSNFQDVTRKLEIGFMSDGMHIDKDSVMETEAHSKYNNCFAFFYRNLNGEVTQIHYRSIYSKAFFTQKIEADKGFFGLKSLFKQKNNFVFLVEGEFDLITPLVLSNSKVPILCMGGTGNYDIAVIESLQKFGYTVILAPDWDSAGEAVLDKILKSRTISDIDFSKIFHIRLLEKNIKDFDELFHKYGNALFQENLYENETLSDYQIRLTGERKDSILLQGNVPKEIKKVMLAGNGFDGIQEHESGNTQLILTGNFPKVDYIMKGFKKGTVGILAGEGSIGKSFFALQLVMCIADISKSLNIYDLVQARGRVGYLTLEDDIDTALIRLWTISKYFIENEGVSPSVFEGVIKNIEVESISGRPFRLLSKEKFSYMRNEKAIDFLRFFAKGKELIIVDTFSKTHALDENNASDMVNILSVFENICNETGASILLLHHMNKAYSGKKGIRGSSVITDNTRFGMVLSKDETTNQKELDFSKMNYAGSIKPIQFFQPEGSAIIRPIPQDDSF